MYKITKTTLEYEEREKLSESEAYACRWQLKMQLICALFMAINSILYTILFLVAGVNSDKVAFLCMYVGMYCAYLVLVHIGSRLLGKVFNDNL